VGSPVATVGGGSMYGEPCRRMRGDSVARIEAENLLRIGWIHDGDAVAAHFGAGVELRAGRNR